MQGFCLDCNEMKAITTYEETEGLTGMLLITAKCDTCGAALVNIEIKEWIQYGDSD